MLQTIGKRIAQLRQAHGWTQQSLAERLAISRVAVSHIEMDISVPEERTITLMAGLFKISPHELVENTTYPRAKTDRLPHAVCAYTPLELDLALMENDLRWLDALQPASQFPALREKVYLEWTARLSTWREKTTNAQEVELLDRACWQLRQLAVDATASTERKPPPSQPG